MLREMANRKYISLTKPQKPQRNASPISLYCPKKNLHQIPVCSCSNKEKLSKPISVANISNRSSSSVNISYSKNNKDNSICAYNYKSITSNTLNKIKSQKQSNNLSISTNAHSKSYIDKESKNSKTYKKSNSMTDINILLHENNKTFCELIQKKNASSISTARTKSTEGDYYRNMETIISEIRKKGFDKLQKEIEDKLNLKRKLEQSITTLKQNITTYNNKKKYWSKENEKILQKISELKNTSERFKSLNYDLDVFHKYNPDPKKELDLVKDEIVQREKMTSQIKGEITVLKENIKKTNKKIFDIEKENDQLRQSILIVKKRTDILRTKLSITDKNNQEVIQGMSIIVNSGIC